VKSSANSIPAACTRALLVTVLLSLLSSCDQAESITAAYRIENLNQWVGGPAANAVEGDFLLENEHLRVGVLSTRCSFEEQEAGDQCSSPGPGLFGGSLVDLDLRRTDSTQELGGGQDRFTELFDALNLDIMETQSVEVLSDGSDGSPAIVRSQGPSGDYISYLGLVGAVLSLPKTWHITDYILNPGEPYLRIRTTAVILDDEGEYTPDDPCGWQQGDDGLPCEAFRIEPAQGGIPLLDAMVAGGSLQFGDFFMAGGDVDIFVPGMGFHEEKEVAEAYVNGINTLVEPFTFPYIAASGDQVSYAMGTGGTLSAPLFMSSITAVFGAVHVAPLGAKGQTLHPQPGTAFTYERYMTVGEGDVGSAYDRLQQAFVDDGFQTAPGQVVGTVREEDTFEPLSRVEVLVYQDTGAERDALGLPPKEDLYSHWQTDRGQDPTPDGSFGGLLPEGDYLLVAKEPGRGPSQPQAVRVQSGESVTVGLLAPRTGILEFQIVDERGRALPSKISLRPVDAAGAINRPDLGDPYLPEGYTKVAFAPYGHSRLNLAPAAYDIVVSRGVEYSLWNSIQEGYPSGIQVDAGGASRIEVILEREVDTTGFISADLHVHAAPSPDSGVPLDTRVVTMACEGVEFLSGTDHDVITDYRPVIQELGLDAWVQASVGIESTTIEVGHYLSFPLTMDYSKPLGGAFDWTNKTPQDLIDTMREHGAHDPDETVVFVGHPRDGILGYFDQFGLDPFQGSLLRPHAEPSFATLANPVLSTPEEHFTMDFDGFEVLNGKRFELIRTPTHEEVLCQRSYTEQEPLDGCENGVSMYTMLERSMDEQRALEDLSQPFFLTRDMQGQIDDWFTLLNLGYRHTVLGNSDTHGLTKTESGCPRNFVISPVDEAELIDERDVARAVQNHGVVASYGPLLNVNLDGAPIGSELSTEDGTATLSIEVQAPRWMRVDRIEVYENARLIHEITGDALDVNSVVKYRGQLDVAPTGDDGLPRDAWYVVIALGDQDLGPLFTPVSIPRLELAEVVTEAIGEIDLGGFGVDSLVGPAPAFPRTFSVLPYAVANPIWLDVDGDRNGDGQDFEPLGAVPDWFRPAPQE